MTAIKNFICPLPAVVIVNTSFFARCNSLGAHVLHTFESGGKKDCKDKKD